MANGTSEEVDLCVCLLLEGTVNVSSLSLIVYKKNAYVETVAMVSEESMAQADTEANEKSNGHEVYATCKLISMITLVHFVSG